ncbi:MAG TPA: glycerol-3-phosphate acyltransferase [Gemmatimonadaceae bacterium]|nr:glycerol-3-phosphate acyltransferase [Gemmatimonadaceae bacterium]
MAEWAMAALVLLGAYALGCANGAYYLVRLRTRQDLRALGSGNAGARNAGRVLGRAGFTSALVLDALKGIVVVLGSRALGANDAVTAFAASSVVIGHIWPAQLGFRGGKGAATAIGVLAVYDVRVAAVVLVAGLLLLALTRRLMVGGFVALVSAPVVASLFGHEIGAVAGIGTMTLAVVVAHRADVAVSVAQADAALNDVPDPTGTYASR